MEVAGQWRREWAGTAEYGKVTEGGVTRRVARALEVLHASGPGARVRVMRAAYHSSAGPGVPAASYMVHSSRRVISSGSNFLESPTTPTKPLEISSTPLDSVATETENYKVTEPDDIDISEPSKWRVSTGRNSIRMPSEESSSTADNASIIDLDLKTNHKSIFRKYSNDSENSDIQYPRSSARSSPLLDAPATLSTLKYKSLLNSSNDWNNRRKSYSFEDTSPLSETILHSNDTLAMESSTDSGICKSTEIVNDHADDNTYSKHFGSQERKQTKQDETFKGWLSKNRPNSFFKGTQLKPHREHHDVSVESNISLQSTGKVSITLPVTIDDDYQYKRIDTVDDGDRKVKKVEFCKTELHFAADSGTVNIIETDEKPPPSNDFRRRRSAFVPMRDKFEKSVTLFGEKVNNFTEINKFQEVSICDKSEIGESDENTAATKSILKNKIPKPKPYLLGENMVFGNTVEQANVSYLDNNSTVPTAVSLINKQLQVERTHSNEIIASEVDTRIIKTNDLRATETGPLKNNNSRERTIHIEVEENNITTKKEDIYGNNSVRYKLKVLQMSPIQGKPKTRQLRESDLPYFGINSGRENINEITSQNKTRSESSSIEDIFQSVKLIKEISSSVCNSETESEDSPQYQNLPLKTNFDPIPIPRRFKYEHNAKKNDNLQILKPIFEQDIETSNLNLIKDSRRSRLKRCEEITPSSRSLSEPPKINRNKSLDRSFYRHNNNLKLNDSQKSQRSKMFNYKENTPELSKNESPLYANINNEEMKTEQMKQSEKKLQTRINETRQNHHSSENKKVDQRSCYNKVKKATLNKSTEVNDKNSLKKKQSYLKKIDTHSLGKVTSDNNQRKINCGKSEKPLNHISNKTLEDNTHRSRSPQKPSLRHTVEEEVDNSQRKKKHMTKKISENDESKIRRRNSSQDKTHLRKELTTVQNPEVNTKDRHGNFTDHKNREKNGTEKNLDTSLDKTARRSGYVINYDDKNGTVSSVCKIKPGSSTPRRKKIPYDKVKEFSKEQNVKNRTSDKKILRNAAPRTTKEHKQIEIS